MSLLREKAKNYLTIRKMKKHKVTKIIECNVLGIELGEYKRVWVDDSTAPDGGYFENYFEAFPSPRIKLSFKGEADGKLSIGGGYIGNDGSVFRAVSEKEFINYYPVVGDKFIPPTEIVLVTS